jgi:hypothetical protein
LNLFIVFALFILLYFLFTWKAGEIYPILYLFLFIYFVQYVFSVYLTYNEFPLLRKEMPIPQEQLFDYIIPALAFLFAGVFIFNKDVPVLHALNKIDRRQAAALGHLLLFISFFFDAAQLLRVPGIGSIISFTYYLKYAGAMCYLFAPSTFHYALLVLVYLGLAQNALSNSIFIDFFMWSTHLFSTVSLRYNLSLKVRSTFIVMAMPLLVIIQSVKHEYREATWSGKRESGVGLFTELAGKEKDNGPFAKSDGVTSTVGRLNQGWHLAKVLRWVPKRKGFSNGEDMLGDIEGSILPRVFFPNKKVIGSQDKFYEYTGHKLIGNTSMTIGILGDFYINFGRSGSFVGLFIFGAFVSRLLYFFMRKHVLADPINIVWVPFLFSYLVRANNDFYIVFNNLVKGYLIFLFVSYIRKQLWPVRPIQNQLQ